MRVIYARSALADIDQISSYVRERNPRAAVSVADAIEATVARIGMFPFSAPASDEPDVRMAPAGRYSYLIFYTVTDDEVLILRVIHAARMRPWERRSDESDEPE
jgi:toxin ParE1/3/4